MGSWFCGNSILDFFQWVILFCIYCCIHILLPSCSKCWTCLIAKNTFWEEIFVARCVGFSPQSCGVLFNLKILPSLNASILRLVSPMECLSIVWSKSTYSQSQWTLCQPHAGLSLQGVFPEMPWIDINVLFSSETTFPFNDTQMKRRNFLHET